jgi:hypothetical protein
VIVQRTHDAHDVSPGHRVLDVDITNGHVRTSLKRCSRSM